MGAVNTTYTFTATDTITSTKMNNIIDQTVMTADALLGGSNGDGGLSIADGKLTISSGAINSSRLASNSVSSSNIVDGTIVNADINASAAIAGTKISPDFGTQNIQTTGNATTGTLYLSRQDASTEGGELQFRKAFDATTAFTVDCQGAGHSPDLRIFGTTGQVATITAAGNVGVGTSSPQVKLQVAGGAIRVEGHAGEGGQIELLNAANNDIQAVFDVDSNDTTRIWTLPFEPLSFGTNSGEKMRISASGNVGIGKNNPSTILDVNGTVTATAFAGQLFGQADSATTASTVSNGAITAAKLDGAQSGSAPVYGVRAFVQFEGRNTNGSCTIRSSGNISSVSRTATGKYTVNFSTPMQSLYYAVTCSASSSNVARIACADRATAALSSIEIETYTSGGTADDFTENSVMIIE